MVVGSPAHDVTALQANAQPIDSECVSSFKYLGSIKTSNGDCSKDVQACIALSKQRMIELPLIPSGRN